VKETAKPAAAPKKSERPTRSATVVPVKTVKQAAPAKQAAAKKVAPVVEERVLPKRRAVTAPEPELRKRDAKAAEKKAPAAKPEAR